MITYCKAKKEDMEDIIDFINYVFSQGHRPHDFKALLPKLYVGEADSARYHFLVKEKDKIKAVVGAFPTLYEIGGKTLKACGIGMVSVHPYARSKGYMKGLMQAVLEDAREQGYAFAFLGGQRQRYEYFGFEPAETRLNFTLTATNLRHTVKSEALLELTLVPIEGEALRDQAFALYQTQAFRAVRQKEDFLTVLGTWNGKPFAFLHEGTFAGYASLRDSSIVQELMLERVGLYPAAMTSLMRLTDGSKLYLSASPYEHDKVNYLTETAEAVTCSAGESLHVFNWQEMLEAFLRLKAQTEPLAPGTLILSVSGNTFCITVENDTLSVSESTAKADLSLPELKAVSLIFSFTGNYLKEYHASGLSEEKARLVRSWFPITLFFSPCDGC